MVVMGGIVGAGIFLNPAIVARETGSYPSMLGAWLIGGVCALIGAFVYAELSARRPLAGGQYVYLREALHPAVGFLYGWALLVVIQTGGMADCAIAFARYFEQLFPVRLAETTLAAIVMAALTLVNCLGVAAGNRLQSVLMVLKIVALGGLIVCGFAVHTPAAVTTAGTGGPAGLLLGAPLGEGLGAALIPVLFCYGGWQTACFVAGEMKDPRRDLPRALVLGVLGVIALYTLVAVACGRALGLEHLAVSAAPASEVAMRALGPKGATIIAGCIAISTLGFLSQSVLTAPRVYFAMAQDGLFFESVGRLSQRTKAPVVAIVLQGLLAVVIAYSGEYEAILRMVVSMDFVFMALTAVTLFVFRRREPLAQARMPGHPWTTLVFIGICAWVVLAVWLRDPFRAVCGLALTIAGLPVYLLWNRRKGAHMKLLAVVLFASLPAFAQERKDPRIVSLVQRVDPARMHATVAKLVSFGTRNTLSAADDPKRGIGAARRWLAEQFGAIAQGTRMKPFEDRFMADPGPRIPAPVELINVGVMLPGSDPSRGKDAIVMTGHYDSMPSDVKDPKTDAPGANDDGSGTSMTLELANAFAHEQPAVTVFIVAVAGEEQGLVGSKHLAERLQKEGWNIIAMTSVDIAGNSEGMDGTKDSTTGRIFSEGTPDLENEAQKKLRLAIGNENDSLSREWARYLQRVGELYSSGLRLRVMLRRDRIARGSDHMSFSRLGFTAIRLSEARENYHRQHQTPRVENGVQYGDDLAHFDALYASRLCKALAAAMASLSFAPAAPSQVTLLGAVSPDAHLRWTLPANAADVVLYRRPADAVTWTKIESLGKVSEVVLPSVTTDDWFFAVATADAAGNQSLATPPGAVGR
jgi:APA family basic amino acid/polyamine antiporter